MQIAGKVKWNTNVLADEVETVNIQRYLISYLIVWQDLVALQDAQGDWSADEKRVQELFPF